MLKVKVTEEIINHCKEQVRKYNFGQRKDANGTPEQQLLGIIGQSVVMNIFGFGYVYGGQGCDGGIDFVLNGKKVDVKTMGRTTDVKPNFTNNFVKYQDCLDTDIYIFCSYNKIYPELTICGWTDKENFNNKRRFYPKGTERKRSDGSILRLFTDTFEIDNADLFQINNIEQLKNFL